jgi:hypothetical protein
MNTKIVLRVVLVVVVVWIVAGGFYGIWQLDRKVSEPRLEALHALPVARDSCKMYAAGDRERGLLAVCEGETISKHIVVYCMLIRGGPERWDPVPCSEVWNYQR